jgi:glycosyltransferase involved in cell wall biosynthesis
MRPYSGILFLDQSGEFGGAELCLADLAEFSKENSAVFLFQEGPFADFLRARKIVVHVANLPKMAARVGKTGGLLAYLFALPGMAMLLYRVMRVAKNFDLLYANTAKALVVGAILAFLLRKKLCFHLHDIVSADHFSATNRRLIVSLANRAHAVVANSQATADAYISNGGNNHHVRVIPNGFEISRFHSVSRNASPDSANTVPRTDFPVAGLFGRITRWKGQHLFIQALAELPGVHGLIVGEALFTEEDHRYARELKSLAVELKVANRIRFTGFRTDILPLLRSVDLVVHCSTSPEPFGRVIVEAMLAGRPVIASKAGGALEILKDNQTGLLIEPCNSHALAKGIEKLLQNRDFAAQMGQAAKREAEERFSLDRVLTQWRAFIGEIANSPSPCS